MPNILHEVYRKSMNETEQGKHHSEYENWRAPENAGWRSPEQEEPATVDVEDLPSFPAEPDEPTLDQPTESESTVEGENTEQRFIELRHAYTQALENYKYEARDRYAREQEIHQEIEDPNNLRDLYNSQPELAELVERARPYIEAIDQAKQEFDEFLAQNPDIAERRNEHLQQVDKDLTELNYKYGAMAYGMPGPREDRFPKLQTLEAITKERAGLMEDEDYKVLNLERAIANPNLQAVEKQETNKNQ